MTYVCIKLALQGIHQQKKDFLGFWNIAEKQSEANTCIWHLNVFSSRIITTFIISEASMQSPEEKANIRL